MFLCLFLFLLYCFVVSRPAEKYIRRSRLDWSEGAASRESIKAVLKLHCLQVSSHVSVVSLSVITMKH